MRNKEAINSTLTRISSLKGLCVLLYRQSSILQDSYFLYRIPLDLKTRLRNTFNPISYLFTSFKIWIPIHVLSILLIFLAPKRTLLNANRQVSLLTGQIYGNFIWIIEALVWEPKPSNPFFGKTLFLKERKRSRPRHQKCFFC